MKSQRSFQTARRGEPQICSLPIWMLSTEDGGMALPSNRVRRCRSAPSTRIDLLVNASKETLIPAIENDGIALSIATGQVPDDQVSVITRA